MERLMHLLLHPLHIVNRVLILRRNAHLFFKVFVTALHASAFAVLYSDTWLRQERQRREHTHWGHHHWHRVHRGLHSEKTESRVWILASMVLKRTVALFFWNFIFRILWFILIWNFCLLLGCVLIVVFCIIYNIVGYVIYVVCAIIGVRHHLDRSHWSQRRTLLLWILCLLDLIVISRSLEGWLHHQVSLWFTTWRFIRLGNFVMISWL